MVDRGTAVTLGKVRRETLNPNGSAVPDLTLGKDTRWSLSSPYRLSSYISRSYPRWPYRIGKAVQT